ncbi:MAG: WD40/YVTN/BNR-like repeat-containing protein, partial [Anaerolineae bacterium]
NPLLAGTPVGVFRSLSRGDNWSWANRGLVGLQVATLAASSNGVLFLGTLDGTLARSVDGGYSWASLPRLEDSGSITSIAVSPDYLNDGTILVGTENGGIYRSTDSGRSAKPANFGLGDLSVLTIACAPGWPKKPVAFAGSASGLFRSTNGGRAWRSVGGDLDGLPVQAVVVSPRFERDGSAFVATEEDGLFRTRNGGTTWELIGTDIPDATINALWISPRYAETHTLLAGTSASGLFRSADGGESWSQVLDTGDAVLALAGDDETVFAGFHNTGAYRSRNAGLSWDACQEGLHANALTNLVSASSTLFSAGPDTGIFEKTGDGWQPLTNMPSISGIGSYAAAPDFDSRPVLAVADIEKGLLLSTDGGANWAEASSEAITAVTAANDAGGALVLWAGTGDGRILISSDDGASWVDSGSTLEQAVVQLQPSASFATDSTIVAATRNLGDASAPMGIWRSRDGGRTWQRLLQEETGLAHISFAVDHAQGGRLLVALDRYLLIEGEGSWRRIAFGEGEPPVLSVAIRYGDDGTLYMVGTTMGVYYSQDTIEWRPLMRGMGYAPVLSFAPVVAESGDQLWALGLGGLVWQWDEAQSAS